MTPTDFSRDLRGFPSEVVVELEDHLSEVVSRSLKAGANPVEARRAALRSLGDLTQLRRDVLRSRRSPLGFRAGLGWPMKAVIGAWMALGLFLVSRVCVAPEPTFGSITACIGVGLACAALGSLLLRGGRRALEMARGVAMSAVFGFGLCWSSAAVHELMTHFGIHPGMLLTGMLIALITVAVLLAVQARGAPPLRAS